MKQCVCYMRVGSSAFVLSSLCITCARVCTCVCVSVCVSVCCLLNGHLNGTFAFECRCAKVKSTLNIVLPQTNQQRVEDALGQRRKLGGFAQHLTPPQCSLILINHGQSNILEQNAIRLGKQRAAASHQEWQSHKHRLHEHHHSFPIHIPETTGYLH